MCLCKFVWYQKVIRFVNVQNKWKPFVISFMLNLPCTQRVLDFGKPVEKTSGLMRRCPQP